MTNYFVPLKQIVPFIQHLEAIGYDTSNMPDIVLEEEWIEYCIPKPVKDKPLLLPNYETEVL